jgi:hypothetical protein
MKKLLIITLIVFVSTIALVLDSFSQPQPQYGGILRRINPTGARVLGYYPEMGPQDSTEAFPRSRMFDGADEGKKNGAFSG